MNLSVILPVYNGARFLDRTMRNLVEEQFDAMAPREWEIIAVNDGSTDATEQILNSWAERYPDNITVISGENRGVSMARNHAMACAKGRYIYFMDADDLLMRHALPRILDIALARNPDMMRFEFAWLQTGDYERYANAAPEAPVAIDCAAPSPREFLDQTLGMVEYPAYWSVWSAMFRRDFLTDNALLFIPGLHFGEDYIFMWQALLKAKTLLTLSAQLYLYNFRPENASNPTTPQGIKRKINAIKSLIDYQEELYALNSGSLTPRAAQGMLLQAQHHCTALRDAFELRQSSVGKRYAKLRRRRLRKNHSSAGLLERLLASFLFDR